MERYRYDDYANPSLVDEMFKRGMDNGQCQVVLTDKIIQSGTRVAMLNFILWECLTKYDIHPSSQEFLNYKSITTGSISKVHSRYYTIMLERRPDIQPMEFVDTIFSNINRFYNIICRYLNEYMPSIDALSLARLCANPEIKKLIDTKIDEKLGTKVAESIIKQQKNALIELISKKNALKDNCLYLYMLAETLKTNQIPQMLLKYGPRSDIDDTMRRHVINESSFSGLKSVADFATEYLSAKKSAHFNKSVVRRSQYFSRKVRLAVSSIKNLYPGSCGSEVTVPLYLKPEYADNVLERTIVVDGQDVRLSDANIGQYVGKVVNLRSVFGCRHTDGFCERCAGYRWYPEKGYGLLKFMPKDIHIGLICTVQLMSRVTQKILSNKHLIATNSKEYNLPEVTAKYLYNDNDCNVFWNSAFSKNLKNCQIRIPADSIGLWSDLMLEALPSPETFSTIAYLDIVKDDVIVDSIYLEADGFVPFLSQYTLEYMRKQYDSIEYRDNGYIVDMKGFDVRKPFMNYVVMNDDMISYVNRVKSFLSAGVANETSVSKCITDFADVVYHKSALNLFYLEVVLRAFNIENEDNYRIPVINDIDHTKFAGLDYIISESTISMKLAHEHLNRFLSNPSTMLEPKRAGLFREFFGII